ncbi:MAG TPA: CheR family methyltransferase [Candidatus Dormibacteraeota bacterium]
MSTEEQTEDQIEGLLDYLAQARGFDFRAYKRPTLTRRIHKRMREVGAESYSEYLDRLQVDADEFGHLFDAILINVTAFFRDPEHWDYIGRHILPTLIGEKPATAPIRVWTAGCASGEEAYSIAMLLADALGSEGLRRRVKVYATDVDEDALAIARAGAYPSELLQPVPPEMREKYFEHVGSRLVFRTDLRRSLIFGRHDLVQDAPISRLDLLLCRNTLMYFTPQAQDRVLAQFNYALNPNGFLFLGKAEMMMRQPEMFRSIDLKQRVFMKVPPHGLRDRLAALRDSSEPERVAESLPQLPGLASDAAPFGQMLLNAEGIVVAANALVREWFGIEDSDLDRPLQDLEMSYRPVELRSLIARAHEQGRTLTIRDVEQLRESDQVRHLDLTITPLVDGKVPIGTSLVFNDVSPFHELRRDLERAQHELETAYEELQSTNEELETTNEELQSTVEELETTNEELQSSNEELETMNEELESTNSELQNFNNELRLRTEEVDQVNTFLDSIVSGLQLGLIVLDQSLEVRMWNDGCEDLWGVRLEEAVGRPISDLDIGLPLDDVVRMVREAAVDGASPQEATVAAVNRRGRNIRCRIVASRLPVKGDGGPAVVLLIEQLKDEAPVP